MSLNQARKFLNLGSSRLVDTKGRTITAMTKEGRLLYKPSGHSLCLGPAGSRKTTTMLSCGIISAILNPSISCVCIDPKDGENAAMWAPVARAYGRPTYIIDPKRVLRRYGSDEDVTDINPSGSLVETFFNNPEDLVDALEDTSLPYIPEPGNDEKNRVWRDRPKSYINYSNLSLLERNPKYCTPGGAATFLNEPNFSNMLEIDAEEGSPMLQNMAATILSTKEDVPEHHSQFLSSAQQALRGYQIGTKLHDFGLNAEKSYGELLNEKAIIFVVGEQRYMASNAPLFGSILNGFMQAQLSGAPETHYLIDEATNIPSLSKMIERMTVSRGYGGHLFFTGQSISEFERVFGEKVTKTLIDNTVIKMWLAFGNEGDAEKTSRTIGETLAHSTSINRQSSQISHGKHINISRERIISAQRLMAMDEDEMLIHVRGVGYSFQDKLAYNHISPFAYEVAPNHLEGGVLPPDIKVHLKTPRKG